MPQDAYGNWVPGTNQEPWTGGASIIGGGGGGGCSCLTVVTSVPDNADGDDGDVRIDSSTGIIYQKQSGVWTVIGSVGAGGHIEILTGAEDNPNGTYTPEDTTQPAMYYPDSDANALWRWSPTQQIWLETINFS